MNNKWMGHLYRSHHAFLSGWNENTPSLAQGQNKSIFNKSRHLEMRTIPYLWCRFCVINSVEFQEGVFWRDYSSCEATLNSSCDLVDEISLCSWSFLTPDKLIPRDQMFCATIATKMQWIVTPSERSTTVLPKAALTHVCAIYLRHLR